MKTKEINHLYLTKALLDEIVIKAFGLSEVAQIARTEKRLRELFQKQWVKASNKARKRYAALLRPKMAKRIFGQIAKEWRKSVEKIFLDELEYIYRLARVAGYKKVTGKEKGSLQYDTEQFDVSKAGPLPRVAGFSFNQPDQAAIKAIQEQQTFWLGEFIDGFSEAIEEVSREVILEFGESPRGAGPVLRERIEQAFEHFNIPDGFQGTAIRYFEGLTANAATVARAHGQLMSLMEADAKYFKIVNPIDERTCPRCRTLDGQTFPLQQGVDQMEAEQSANTIDKVKEAHPWLSTKEILQIKGNSTERNLSGKLAKAGVVLPPYHFRCRCTIDIV